MAVNDARYLRRPGRFKETYWAKFPGLYFAGDGAKKDEEGDIWLLGRIDDVMNISGHRLSTTEVEHALVGFPRLRKRPSLARATQQPAKPLWRS